MRFKPGDVIIISEKFQKVVRSPTMLKIIDIITKNINENYMGMEGTYSYYKVQYKNGVTTDFTVNLIDKMCNKATKAQVILYWNKE